MLVFGIIPKGAIYRGAVPPGNILHIDSTFSCVLIVLALPVAGIGLASCVDGMGGGDWLRHLAFLVLCMIGVLLGLYFGLNRHLSPQRLLFRLCPHAAGRPHDASAGGEALSRREAPTGPARLPRRARSGLAALHWRQGQYLSTAFGDLDVSASSGPGRLPGRFPRGALHPGTPRLRRARWALDSTSSPDLNSMYLIEDIYGIEALRSREYEGHLGLRPRPSNGSSPSTTYKADEGSADHRAAFDALNVGRFLRGKRADARRLLGVGRGSGNSDLNVYRSPTCSWLEGVLRGPAGPVCRRVVGTGLPHSWPRGVSPSRLAPRTGTCPACCRPTSASLSEGAAGAKRGPGQRLHADEQHDLIRRRRAGASRCRRP